MKAVAGGLPTGADRDAWAYEVKWDGMRIVTAGNGDAERLWSSNRIEVTHRFPELAGVAAALAGRPCVIDGEIIATDGDGRPSFSVLQSRMHVDNAVEARRRAALVPVTYVVFDVMHFDGHDLVELSYEERRGVLLQLFEAAPGWRLADSHDDGDALLAAVRAQGLEGVMAKRRASVYTPGRRSSAWRKVKVRLHAEFVVGGWLPGTGGRLGRIGAVLVGYFDDDRAFRFAGRVGSGFGDAELDTMATVLAPLARDADPFSPPLTRADAPGARFVEPQLVIEVAYGEWTPDGRLRHPSYLGRRFDKDPRAIRRP